jgi:hypothetical protein
MSLISLDEQQAVVADGAAGGVEGTQPEQTASLAAGAGSPPAAATRLPAERIELTPERREAIAAIRARAEEERIAGKGDYPNVFETPSLGETAPKSTADVDRIEESLDDDAAEAEAAADEGDPSVYEDRAKWLWRLGQTHVQASEEEITADD